jgi:flagellar assembly protein FliH
LSSDFKNFTPDQYPEGQAGVSSQFNLDEYVREANSLKSEFIHDLEQQRDKADTSVAREDVNEFLTEAKQKMEVEAAKAQEEAQQKGYEEGQEKGFKAGEQKVKEYFESSLKALKVLIEQLSEVREKTYPLLEREMVEMVTTLAGKVIRTELAGRENGIREIVRMAVESVLDRESLVIKIHPEDHKELEDYGQELIQLFHEIKNVEFQSHASVARGHCIAESNFGTVEAGLDHLDEHIKRVLHLAPPAPLPTARPEETDKPEPPEEPIELANLAETEVEDAPTIDAEAFDDDLAIEPDDPLDPDAEDDPKSSF